MDKLNHTASNGGLHSVKEFVRNAAVKRMVAIKLPHHRIFRGQLKGFEVWMKRKHMYYVYNLRDYIPYIYKYFGIKE